MEEVSFMYSKYAGALMDPANPDACHQLRSDKWATCHPEGGEMEVCSADMDVSTLQSLHEAHRRCYQYRTLENESHCFSSPDKGHIKAQKMEKKRADSCLDLLHQKMSQQKQDVDAENDVEEEEPEPKPKARRRTSKSKSKLGFWKIVLFILLILVALFLLFLFLLYVQ